MVRTVCHLTPGALWADASDDRHRSVVHPATLAKGLGGHKSGSGWIARCPAHDGRTPSLSIRGTNGKLLVHCHAGCSQRDVIAALRARGLWTVTATGMIHRFNQQTKIEPPHGDQPRARTAAALAIWRAAIPAAGSPVETYLHARRLALPADVADLRFHPACPRGPDRLPAMVSLMRDIRTNDPCGLHRTFLRPDGSGKVEGKAKAMLGRASGAVVKLVDDAEVSHGLGLAEGIETALAVLCTGWLSIGAED